MTTTTASCENLEGLAVGEKVRFYLVTEKGFLGVEVERVNARLVKLNDQSVELALVGELKS